MRIVTDDRSVVWDNEETATEQRCLPNDGRSIMAVLQIALLVGAGVVAWLLAVALIVVWVMGMSRNAAVDDEKFRRDLALEKDEAAPKAAATTDRTSA